MVHMHLHLSYDLFEFILLVPSFKGCHKKKVFLSCVPKKLALKATKTSGGRDGDEIVEVCLGKTPIKSALYMDMKHSILWISRF